MTSRSPAKNLFFPRPGTSLLKYTSRVDNRLPVRHGFRLWNVARLPREAGVRVLLPVGAVTDDGASAMHTWPAMLRAAVAMGQDQMQVAQVTMEQILLFDPARPEAVALLADVYQKSQQTDKAMTARTDAERLFQRNEQARRDYEALLREARDGIWAGIPRP